MEQAWVTKSTTKKLKRKDAEIERLHALLWIANGEAASEGSGTVVGMGNRDNRKAAVGMSNRDNRPGSKCRPRRT
jgi:hypothetical protein